MGSTMRKEIVAVACTASDGSPAVPFYEVEVTQDQYDLGEHYDMAIEQAMEARYERPFVPFDSSELFHLEAAGDIVKSLRKGGQLK